MTLPSSAALLLVVLALGVSAPAPAQSPERTGQSPPRTPEQTAWVTERALPFDTVDAGHGFDDLMPLVQLIGDARIVALGEPTHGSREVFQMKHRLVEFLATEMGFTIFSIEANMPEAYRVNNYVARGAGDPAELDDVIAHRRGVTDGLGRLRLEERLEVQAVNAFHVGGVVGVKHLRPQFPAQGGIQMSDQFLGVRRVGHRFSPA